MQSDRNYKLKNQCHWLVHTFCEYKVSLFSMQNADSEMQIHIKKFVLECFFYRIQFNPTLIELTRSAPNQDDNIKIFLSCLLLKMRLSVVLEVRYAIRLFSWLTEVYIFIILSFCCTLVLRKKVRCSRLKEKWTKMCLFFQVYETHSIPKQYYN